MNEQGFEISAKNVANYLKCIINQNCKDGFKWYPEATAPTLSVMDLAYAIEILEAAPNKDVRIKMDDDIDPMVKPRRMK